MINNNEMKLNVFTVQPAALVKLGYSRDRVPFEALNTSVE